MSTPAEDRRRNLRVGIFLVGTIALLVGTIFLLGRSQGIFVRKVTLHTWFTNIGGLAIGAPVRLGGLDVGLVKEVHFATTPQERRIQVDLGIERQYLSRIRVDSIAKLGSKGLLGDSLIDITVGSATAAEVAPDATIPSEESQSIDQIAGELRTAIAAIRGLSDRFNAVASAELARDVGRIAKSTAAVVEEVERGQGLLHTVIYDRAMGAKAELLIANASRAVQRVDQLLEREGAPAIADVRSVARDLAAVAAELRTGDGLLHGLVYDREAKQLVANLTSLSQTLKRVGDDVEAGHGTLGALLKDPTVYEDLKIILGNVQRNRLLKSLVRYTIKKDGITP